MSYLNQEIHEQPDVIATLLAKEANAIEQTAQAIADFDPTFVCIAARGTSDNCARYAQYLMGYHLGLPVMLATPSLHTLYETPPNLSRALVIGISQSGEAEDVRQVLQDANEHGGLSLAITNFPESPMAQTAAHHLALHAGIEKSIAATKTYTAQLTVIAQLTAALKKDTSVAEHIQQLPDTMRQTLHLSESIEGWAQRYRYMEQFAVLGRGFNYATAFEISLKVKELTYIASEGYSEADFRHGPIAIIHPGFPVMLVAPQGALLGRMMDLCEKLHERQSEILMISNDDDALTHGIQNMPLPRVPEWISPILAIIPGQLFAMHQATVRGYAVDSPRGLTKVTVTE